MIIALLYKDLMVLLKNNRLILLIMVLFIGLCAVKPGNQIFAIYPALAMGTLSINSLSYDERSRWDRYADALPYGRKRIVTAKYLLSALGIGIALALYLLVMAGSRLIIGSLDLSLMIVTLQMQLLIAVVYTAVLLPVVIRFGLEKAKIIYLVVLCATMVFAISFPLGGIKLPAFGSQVLIFLGLLLAGAILYGISWAVSVRLYQKKVL